MNNIRISKAEVATCLRSQVGIGSRGHDLAGVFLMRTATSCSVTGSNTVSEGADLGEMVGGVRLLLSDWCQQSCCESETQGRRHWGSSSGLPTAVSECRLRHARARVDLCAAILLYLTKLAELALKCTPLKDELVLPGWTRFRWPVASVYPSKTPCFTFDYCGILNRTIALTSDAEHAARWWRTCTARACQAVNILIVSS